ncbi:copper chaperone PCu(A)C [Pseudomonas mangiferae]|uniref:Copper chaperone PCu(A)C n=1 Tax=Pseudomonas mangiferae TaxID=2593654 RepID=A0A553GWR2_9PSED|nr:copper chaperone PCu(A)C [Pseudomonas mangiferae]TRX73895.1 copper chaperone PCu(A)C [Pseudomonas mangiferae]
MRKTLLTLAAVFGLSAAALAHEYQAGALHIDHPWARAMPAVAPTAAAYLVVHNHGEQADRLLGADTPRADKVEIHRHVHQNGLMKMEAVDGGVEIPAGGELKVTPGDYHLMLFGLKQPLEDGQRFPMTLHFQKAGDVTVDIAVQKDAPAPAAPADSGHAHEGMDHGAMDHGGMDHGTGQP